MARITNQKASLVTMMSNTVLFGVAAGLIGYCWLKYSFSPDAMITDGTGWWTMNEKLMLSTVALLLGGFFHSILIMYPEFVKREKQISSSKKLEKELRHQVMNDSLTGIHNRRYFDESLVSYLEEFETAGAGLGLLVLDIDHFKEINDNFGHNIGDQVLKNIANKLKSCTRQLDVVARIGGEEFAVITHCANPEQLAKIAERYRVAISEITVWKDNTAIKPTVSIGIATNTDSNDSKELLDIADGRMYQAKQNGRNQIAA
jgi:diguanylate cyclase (GGDEF)-like protein